MEGKLRMLEEWAKDEIEEEASRKIRRRWTGNRTGGKGEGGEEGY